MAAATPVPVSGAAPSEQELDEVIVRGTPLWKLREAIVAAEERFYSLYNQLNEQDEFDVHCRREAPLGTRLKRRICRISFYEDAQARFTQAMLSGDSGMDAELVLLARHDEYRKRALAVINGDQRLLRLVREREQLERQLAAEYRKRFRKDP